MIRILIYFTILVDIGLLFLVKGLLIIYGIEDDASASSFETYKTLLVPTRDIYIAGVFVVNVVLVGTLTWNYFKNRDGEKLKAIERIGAVISIVTLLTLVFILFCLPRGRLF
jgi:hypothetical protein